MTRDCNKSCVKFIINKTRGLQNMAFEDRRIYPRFPFHSKGELRLNYMAYGGTLIDISLFGALFKSGLSHLNVTEREECTLEILHLNDDSAFSVKGVVVHINENHIGIRFTTLDKEHESKLRKIWTLNLAPPSLLNRKLPALLQAKL